MTNVAMWTRRLWSEFAIGLGAASAIERSVTLQHRPSVCGSEKMKNLQENYVSERRSVLKKAPGLRASDFEVMDGEPSVDWLGVAAFKRELEVLRLRMIDACLRQSEVTVDAQHQFSSDLAGASQSASLPIAKGSRATPCVQEAVTNAVRLLSFNADSMRRREAASPSGEDLARPHPRKPFRRARD